MMKRLLVCVLLLLGASCASAQDLQVQNLTVTGATTLALPPIVTGGCQNILSYGGSGDDSTDNTTPLLNLLAAAPSGHACAYFPPGKFKFASPVVYTFANILSSLTIVGAGSDQTELTWASGSGVTVDYVSPNNSVHIRDLSLTTSGSNSGTALSLNQTVSSYGNPANSAVSDVEGVTIRGADGYAGADFWATGINVSSVSNINFLNDFFTGVGALSGGVGINLHGSSSVLGVVFNFSNDYFQSLGTGIQYGSYVQGVSVSQSNFTGDNYGVTASASEPGVDQLVVTSSQFNCSGDGIWDRAGIPDTMIDNNLFFVPTNAVGVYLQSSYVYSIVGNTFNSSGTNTNGIVIGASNGAGGAISSNVFLNTTTGIHLQSTSSHANVQSNVYSGSANSVVNSGTGNVVGGGSM